ncbi:MAG: patatin-like phospholipase family protein [Bdellovibrionia bacterium]
MSQSKAFRILILPSGGATGIIPAALLAALEQKTGRPTHLLFDEIWCSSIGSVIAALLTHPGFKRHSHSPLSAEEVTHFLISIFSSCRSALRIRETLRRAWPHLADPQLKDTLIPMKILAAEVTKRWGPWPKATQLKTFSTQETPQVNLLDAVSASCTVFPFHWKLTQVHSLTSPHGLYLDAGCEVCTESCMNPFAVFGPTLEAKARELPISLYFFSNGWVRWDETHRLHSGAHPVRLFNLDTSLESIWKKWKKTTRLGRVMRPVNHPRILQNLTGAGALPPSLLIEHAQGLTSAQAFRQVVDSLLSNPP